MLSKGKAIFLIVILMLALLASQVFAKPPGPAGNVKETEETTLETEKTNDEDKVKKEKGPKDEKPGRPESPGKSNDAPGQQKDKPGNPDKEDKSKEDKPGQEEKAGKKTNYHGQITAVDANSITLDPRKGEPVSFEINGDTRIFNDGEGKTYADLSVGMQAVVQAIEGVAIKIHVAPGKPERVHRVGTIVEITAGAITIVNKKGQESTFTLAPGYRVIPEGSDDLLVPGTRVTVVAPRDAETKTWIATGIVVHTPDDDDDVEQDDD
jgi:hypothetical protein